MSGIPDPGGASRAVELVVDGAGPAQSIGFTHATRFPLHKRPNGLDGYIYAVQLSTGLVKVGKTVNPRGRLGAHISHANKVGIDVLNVWLSDRHENFSANERALIAELGEAERGNEYFRRNFDEVVAVAESLSFITRTDAEREARDAAHAAENRSRADQFVRAITQGYQADEYALVRIPADLQVWAIQQLFGTELPPQADPADVKDRAGIRDAAQVIARSLNIGIEDVLDWSYLEILQHLVSAQVQIGYLDLKARALQAGRFDLTDGGYFDDPEGGDGVDLDGFSFYSEPLSLIADEDDPRSVVVGLGQQDGVEAVSLSVRTGCYPAAFGEVLLSANELSDLVGHLELTLAAMREAI